LTAACARSTKPRRRFTRHHSIVRFTYKIRKLTTRAAYESAGHHLRRFFLTRRLPVDFDSDAIFKTIDPEKFEAIRARYRVDNPGEDPPKYLDWRTWLDANLRRVRDLELDLGRRRSVLDIGCGGGYFLYICRLLGHDVLGVDVDDTPMFTEMTELLDVQRVIWRVRAFAPFPDLGRKFDVITAYMICFNNHKFPNLWGVPEWDFFLDDVARHLSPGGRAWLELNREYDGTCYTPQLKDFFESRGAQILSHRVIFNSTLRAPAAAVRAAR
jgi:SAM-dependent methyltransferase